VIKNYSALQGEKKSNTAMKLLHASILHQE